MSRHGPRNKPPTSRENEAVQQESASKSENRHILNKAYKGFDSFKYNNNSFSDNRFVEESF